MRKIHVFQSFSTVYLIRQMFAYQQIIIYKKNRILNTTFVVYKKVRNDHEYFNIEHNICSLLN